MDDFNNLGYNAIHQEQESESHSNNNILFCQRNGQRIIGGPPEGWQGGPPSRGCEVYVTRIPRDCFEQELLPVFSRAGEIYEMRLMMDHNGLNRGYAYVKFTNTQDAKDAVKRLNNFEVRPARHLVVTKSVDNRRLWVNGIPKNRSGQEIRGEMERLTGGVRDIILYPSQADKTKSRGYMFVEYDSHRTAAMARKKLIKGNFHIYGQEIGQVDWAEPENDVDEETMSTVKILFVRNLMLSTTETSLRDLFNKLSGGEDNVERVKKTKDYAFVHFSSRAAAEAALASSENLMVDEAAVEVVWSKPVDKQTYNTRKALTKVFTSGVSLAPDTSLSPRRRGAAGIRGLGAPGTAPPKQLVQRYAGITTGGLTGGLPAGLPHMAPVSRPLTLRSPLEQLQDICLSNGWGEPVYSLVTLDQGEDASKTSQFCYKVTIPNFPLPAPHNSFQSGTYKASSDEAKSEVAGLVLSVLRISPEYLGPALPPPSPTAPVYGLSPAHLQGLPLTAGWPGGFALAPSSIYNRLTYDPYSNAAAYANMINSMYGLTISV